MPKTTVNLLLADDDELLRDHARAQLADEPVHLALACDGMDALEHLRGNPVDLVILDLAMPMMDGFEVLEAIRADERWRFLPVLVVTARDDTSALDRAFELGATGFAVKPINWRLMTRQIRFALRQAKTEHALRQARSRLHERYTQGADASQALLASAAELMALAARGDEPTRQAAKAMAKQLEKFRDAAPDPGLSKAG